jgi:hypothetical protein
VKNHQQKPVFSRLLQCATLLVVMLVTLTATFAQNKDAKQAGANPAQESQQKEQIQIEKVDIKNLPVAGP